jgi:flagellar hook assembly protein FlgD
LVKAQAIVFQTPPVEIYVTFEDGAGRYQLEVVDERGNPLQLIFDKKIVGEGDSWVTWDGKDGQGRNMPAGQYFVIFYKDGQPLRSISVYRSWTTGK